MWARVRARVRVRGGLDGHPAAAPVSSCSPGDGAEQSAAAAAAAAPGGSSSIASDTAPTVPLSRSATRASQQPPGSAAAAPTASPFSPPPPPPSIVGGGGGRGGGACTRSVCTTLTSTPRRARLSRSELRAPCALWSARARRSAGGVGPPVAQRACTWAPAQRRHSGGTAAAAAGAWSAQARGDHLVHSFSAGSPSECVSIAAQWSWRPLSR